MKRSIIAKFLAASGAYLLGAGPMVPFTQAAVATRDTAATSASITTTSSTAVPGISLVSKRIAPGFASFAGSQGNAIGLVQGLRSSSSITVAADTTPGTRSSQSVTFMPPTRRMGWGNVRHALTLAERALAAQGITSPTPAQL